MDIKTPITFQEQLEVIKNRGCQVRDESFALDVLERINYYRLTAYFLPFRKLDGNYIEGTVFEKVYQIHEFDRLIRSICLKIIEEIELKLRTQLAYYHAHKYGPLGYLDAQNFNKQHRHDVFLEHIKQNINENKKQLFVKHHIENYDSKFPIWVIIELFTTGELSFFYSDMFISDKKNLSSFMYGANYSHVSSWLLCLTYLRNYCAHYSRLYYTLFPAIPAIPHDIEYQAGKRIFDYILVLKFLYHKNDKWSEEILPQLKDVIEEYKHSINLDHIGFKDNWYEVLMIKT